jgi:hypothetical protein
MRSSHGYHFDYTQRPFGPSYAIKIHCFGIYIPKQFCIDVRQSTQKAVGHHIFPNSCCSLFWPDLMKQEKMGMRKSVGGQNWHYFWTTKTIRFFCEIVSNVKLSVQINRILNKNRLINIHRKIREVIVLTREPQSVFFLEINTVGTFAFFTGQKDN